MVHPASGDFIVHRQPNRIMSFAATDQILGEDVNAYYCLYGANVWCVAYGWCSRPVILLAAVFNNRMMPYNDITIKHWTGVCVCVCVYDMEHWGERNTKTKTDFILSIIWKLLCSTIEVSEYDQVILWEEDRFTVAERLTHSTCYAIEMTGLHTIFGLHFRD